MPDIKIDQLPAANLPLTGDELLPMDQAGDTVAAPAGELVAAVAADVAALELQAAALGEALTTGLAAKQDTIAPDTFAELAEDAATGDWDQLGPVFTFGGVDRVLVGQQGLADVAPHSGFVEIIDGDPETSGGSWSRWTAYQYGFTLRQRGLKGPTVEFWLGSDPTLSGPNFSVRHNGSNKGAIVQARDQNDFAGVMFDFQDPVRPKVRVEVTPNLPDNVVMGIENGNDGGTIALATDSGSGLVDRVVIRNDGKVQIGPVAPNQLLGVAGPAAGVSLQDTGAGGRSWELLSGSAGAGVFSIFDRSAGHRLTVATSGLVTIAAGGLTVAAGNVTVAAGSIAVSGGGLTATQELYARSSSPYQVAIGAAAGANQAAIAFGAAGDAKLYRTGAGVMATDSNLELVVAGKGVVQLSQETSARRRLVLHDDGTVTCVAA